MSQQCQILKEYIFYTKVYTVYICVHHSRLTDNLSRLKLDWKSFSQKKTMLNVGISTLKEKERMLCVNRLMVNWSSFRGVRKGYIIAHSPQQVHGALTCFEQVFVQCIIFHAEKRGENRTRDQVRLCRIFQKKKNNAHLSLKFS